MPAPPPEPVECLVEVPESDLKMRPEFVSALGPSVRFTFEDYPLAANNPEGECGGLQICEAVSETLP